ncbi:MAG: hypothetical protein AAF986_00905 [Pseudomonadota bacterium]
MERFKSIKTNIPATLLLDKSEEVTGHVVRMAANGMLVSGISLSATPQHAVIYLDSGERFEGSANQVGREIISLSIKPSATRREKLIECMTRHLAEKDASTCTDHSPVPLAPRAKRYCVDAEGASCTLSDGSSVPCRVLDVSLSGLGVAMDHVLAIGDVVRIGKAKAQVTRRTHFGYGMQVIADDVVGVTKPKDDAITNQISVRPTEDIAQKVGAA